jgi:hypothetical protein
MKELYSTEQSTSINSSTNTEESRSVFEVATRRAILVGATAGILAIPLIDKTEAYAMTDGTSQLGEKPAPYLKPLAVMEAEARAILVAKEFVAAFHAGDIPRSEAVLHFPHYRFASGKVTIMQAPGQQPPGAMKLENGKWKYSIMERWDAIQSDEKKVHLAVRYSRYDTSDALLGVYNAIWIVTFEDDKWGIRARSSFAQ